MRNRDYRVVIISLCIMHLFTVGEGRPMRKRTVSEVQLMHDLGEHRQVQERREWLQMRLRGIHTAAAAAAQASSGEAGRMRRRRLRPVDLPDLTPEELQFALNYLEMLLKSKQS